MVISLFTGNKCTIPDLCLNDAGVCREPTTWPQRFLPLSCQSTSLCQGDKVRQLSEWLFGGCFDWHVALQLQKSATSFPRDTTCLAQGTFVRSIFISLLLSQPISPGHSVRHHLSLTANLSSVCVCVCGPVCICVSARVPASAGRVSSRVTWVSQGRSSERGDGRTSREDECFGDRGGYHYSYLRCAWLIFWITVAGC